MSIIVPPIKCQGIKTKLVSNILSLTRNNKFSRWIEPFMGSGVVAFNVIPDNALLCDTNPHLITFYSAIKKETVTADYARCHLQKEGSNLLKEGEDYYYHVRERFNETHDPLDFLFLNRSCFNGIMRFNAKGKFNVPFCRKNNRFTQAYITKITNQIAAVSKIIRNKNFDFCCQDFRKTLSMTNENDFVYCDPPYIDRYTDYFNQWTEQDELDLLAHLTQIPASFILSTWKGNEFRENKYIKNYSEFFQLITQKHFYHVGGSIENRHAVEEALFLNFTPPVYKKELCELEQLALNI